MRLNLIVINVLAFLVLSSCGPLERYELDAAQAAGDEPIELVILRDTEAGVEAAIAPSQGGELSSLRVRFGGEWAETLYLARDYAPRDDWTGKAPLLWPATGRNFPRDLEERRQAGEVFNDGAWEWNGQRYPMPIHGFARDLPWEMQSAEAAAEGARAQLSLEDTPATREMYPFGFRITADYTLAEGVLKIRYKVTADAENEDPMPFSIGNHITFVVPLVSGGDSGSVVLITPSEEEILKTGYGIPTGETRPRSHADGIELADFERRAAVSLTAFSNPRMILKWVGTGEDTGWVVISFLAGSGRGISRGREAQPGRSRIASCATSFLSVRFALRAESGRREPGGRTQARLGGASRPRRGRVSPARAARGQQFPLALLHP